MSRGATIITQKENKGEYNWPWNAATDYDIYAHAFDQVNSSGTPYRYASASSSGTCPSSDIATTSGDRLYSGTEITDQISCSPDTLNAGNYYSFPAATAGSDTRTATSSNLIDTPNSICPKGWQLPPNEDKPNETKKSYNNLIRTAYGITATNSDSALLNNSAMSFVRLGFYHYGNGSLNDRGGGSHYWSSTAYSDMYSHRLGFTSGSLGPQNGDNRAIGFSVRCVSR